MEAGKLDRLITIETPTFTNPNGEVTDAWETFATAWAEVKPNKTIESVGANAQLSGYSATFTMRHVDGINQKMRIVHDSKSYYISAIRYHGRNEFMEVDAGGGD